MLFHLVLFFGMFVVASHSCTRSFHFRVSSLLTNETTHQKAKCKFSILFSIAQVRNTERLVPILFKMYGFLSWLKDMLSYASNNFHWRNKLYIFFRYSAVLYERRPPCAVSRELSVYHPFLFFFFVPSFFFFLHKIIIWIPFQISEHNYCFGCWVLSSTIAEEVLCIERLTRRAYCNDRKHRFREH